MPAPFDSLRDYVAALDAEGLLLRVPELDQDAWEATALVYRATDRYSMFGVPALCIERIRSGGSWHRGPVLALLQSHLDTDALVVGVPRVPGNPAASYRRAKARLHELLAQHRGAYPQLAPLELDAARAPCREVVLRGYEIDLTRFPFLHTNPGDSGRYLNTGSVFMRDPVLGVNFGTYRCELKGPRRLGLNCEPGQTGWKFLQAARARGEQRLQVAIVLGQDPWTWVLSSTRIAPRFNDAPVDELAIAGGLRGRPLEVVRCPGSDLLVPAHCEMVIEGEVAMQQPGLPEGPFGEMFGYLGPRKAENFVLEVSAVSHRRDPWFVNAFAGAQRGMITSPQDAMYEFMLRRAIPGLVEIYQPQDAMGIAIMAIRKAAAGDGLRAGRLIAERNPIAKVVIVVDDDIDVLDRNQVLFAIGSRWQPVPASLTLTDVMGIITDPSQPVQGRTSKIVIDATRQRADEGGRAEFPATNRALLEAAAPAALAQVDERVGPLLDAWEARRRGR